MELVRLVALMGAAILGVGPLAAGEAQAGMRTAPTQGATHLVTETREADVYMKQPKGEGTWPGIVLLHDSMGLTHQMTVMADRLSAQGFVVYAPDLYGGRVALDSDKGRELSVLLDEEAAIGTVEALAAYLSSLKEVGNHRVGVVGLDLGGRLGLKATMGLRQVSALVIVSAKPPSDADSLRRISCPILALFGGKDDSISQGETTAFTAELKAAGRTADVRIFENAAHRFMMEGDPDYSASDAGDAWARTIAFLKENL